MAKRLCITNKVIYFQSSFNRPNLLYEIRDKKACKNIDKDLVLMLTTRFRGKSGIIYCLSRKDCERLAENLKRWTPPHPTIAVYSPMLLALETGMAAYHLAKPC